MSDFTDELRALQEADRLRPFPGVPAYLVCDDGRILKYRQGGWLKPHKMKFGYWMVALWTGERAKSYLVHQIVAFTFHGPRPSPLHHAAHDNGNKDDNSKGNVIWKTKIENEADKIKHGRTNRGERNGMAKLTDDQVREIRATLLNPKRGDMTRIAERYCVTQGAISNIYHGKRRVL